MNSDADRQPSGVRRLATAEEHAAVYAAVAESALDAVIVVDEDGLVVTLNPSAEAIFGYSRKEAEGRSIGELIVPDHLREQHERGMTRYRETRHPTVLGRRVEMEARCKDGRTIPVELAITEVTLSDRRLFTANLRDLSATKAAALEIERQQDALHQNEKLAALGSLLAGVAHELNNPLAIVLGQANMMCEELSGTDREPRLQERARKIEAAAERCARVVRSFLAIARQRTPEKRVIDVAPMLDGALELLRYNLNSTGITVTRDYDYSVPAIFADPDLAHQIVVNVVVNAAQALESVDGSREIRIATRAVPGGMVRIVIADNGPGIPEKIAARIFEPFFTTKPPGTGTGIGLSVSRGLAESQGGALEMQNSTLNGATFELSLPAASEGQGRPVEPSNAADRPEPIAQRVDGANRQRALVVDDEPGITAIVSEALGTIGYACDVASSGRDGQSLIDAHAEDYDAVICDLRMPDIDGPTLFDWIQTNHPDLAERIIFFTGDSLGSNVAMFLARCGRPVLEKPVTPATIIREVASIPARTTR